MIYLWQELTETKPWKCPQTFFGCRNALEIKILQLCLTFFSFAGIFTNTTTIILELSIHACTKVSTAISVLEEIIVHA